MIAALVLIVISYTIGSISSAVLVCKFFGLPDPRTQGSGNPGATNVLRVGGKTAALITLLGDALKGFIPVFIAHLVQINGFMLGLVALAALLGHVFPIFFKFQGGKGVATGFGALFALSVTLGIILLFIWIAVAAITRYSSLAALIAAGAAPILTLVFAEPAYFFPILIITAVLIWRHKDNIQRLRVGSEGKI